MSRCELSLALHPAVIAAVGSPRGWLPDRIDALVAAQLVEPCLALRVRGSAAASLRGIDALDARQRVARVVPTRRL